MVPRALSILCISCLPALGAAQTIVQVFTGGSNGAFLGAQVVLVGDVDLDGFDDLALSFAGGIRVVSPRTGADLASYSLPVHHLEAAGDFDLDGRADLAQAIGGSGALVRSLRNGEILLRVAKPPHSRGLWVFAQAARGVGDLDGDLVPELLVQGGPGGNVFENWGVWAFSGAHGDLLWQVPSAYSFGIVADGYGRSVCVLGDVTGDGVREIAVGAPGGFDNFPFYPPGCVLVQSGATGSLVYSVSGSGTNWDQFGFLAAASDADHDGLQDFFVGAPQDDFAATDGGRVYLFSGRAGKLLETYQSPAPFVQEHFGHALSGGGDVDGDGFPDLVVRSLTGGLARVLSGASGAVLFDTQAYSIFQSLPVVILEDVTGDGRAEIVFGLPSTNASGFTGNGAVYVVSWP